MKSITYIGLLPSLLIVFSSFIWQLDPQMESIIRRAQALDDEEIQLAFLDSVCDYYRDHSIPGAGAVHDYRYDLLRTHGKARDILTRADKTAFYYIYTGEMDRAAQSLEQPLQAIDSIPEKGIKADLYYTKSFLDEKMQENASSLRNIDRAISLYEEMGDSSDVRFGDSYKAKGRILMAMGNFAESINAMAHAKTIFQATKDSVGLADVCQSQGIVYAQIGLYDESKKYIEERQRYMPNAHPMVLAIDKVNLARNALEQKKYEEALSDYAYVLAVSEGIPGAAQYRMYAFNGIIEAAYFSGDESQVQKVYHTMQSELDSLPEDVAPQFLLNQSDYFVAMTNGEFDEAERLAQSLYRASLEKKDGSEAILHTRFLAEVYKRNGNYKKALEYSELYNKANDSILTANKTNALLLYQTQYETKEKEMKINKLAIEKKVEEAKGRTYLWIAGSLAALLLIGGYLIWQLGKARKRLEYQNTELQSLNATKTKFFGIIGHDLGGPLAILNAIGNRIRRQISKQEIDKVEDSVNLLSKTSVQLSSLLDNLMNWALSENGVMPYHPEPINVKAVVEESTAIFEESAKEKGVSIKFQIPEEAEVVADRNAMSVVLRNLISNAVKFTPADGVVQVSANAYDGGVELIVKDSGVGMTAEQIEKLTGKELKSHRGTEGETGTGLGMVLVQELVQLNKGTLDVESQKDKGTRINIRLTSTS